jgi:hypothetical protein
MAQNYEERVRAYDYDGLRRLWTGIQAGSAGAEWEPGKAFEHLILRAFQVEGAEVVWPYEVRQGADVVEQIDGVIYTNGLSCLIEAKDYSGNVDFQPVAKLRSQLLRRPASAIGVVFSRNGFTEPAKIMTRYTMPQTVLLWEGTEIAYALERQQMCQGLQIKFRYAVERGLPDYNLTNGGLP